MTCNTIPARPSFTSAFAAWVLGRHDALNSRYQQRKHRAELRRMLKLDDALLKDVGVTRQDILWASRLPLSHNAGDALHNIANGHRNRD